MSFELLMDLGIMNMLDTYLDKSWRDYINLDADLESELDMNLPTWRKLYDLRLKNEGQ